MAVQNTYYKPPTTNSNTCIFTSCPVGDVPTSLLSHCYSPTGAVSVPLCLCYLVPSRGPGWYVVPLPGELWVTLNFPLNDIDFSLLFSHLYKLNLVTIQHSTPMKTNHLQRFEQQRVCSTGWRSLRGVIQACLLMLKVNLRWGSKERGKVVAAYIKSFIRI